MSRHPNPHLDEAQAAAQLYPPRMSSAILSIAPAAPPARPEPPALLDERGAYTAATFDVIDRHRPRPADG